VGRDCSEADWESRGQSGKTSGSTKTYLAIHTLHTLNLFHVKHLAYLDTDSRACSLPEPEPEPEQIEAFTCANE